MKRRRAAGFPPPPPTPTDADGNYVPGFNLPKCHSLPSGEAAQEPGLATGERVHRKKISVVKLPTKLYLQTYCVITPVVCLLPILDYGINKILPRISKMSLLKLERQYRMALKVARGLQRELPTETLWNMLDVDPWYIRAHDQHEDMFRKISGQHEVCCVSVRLRLTRVRHLPLGREPSSSSNRCRASRVV
ncbi:hypothetical protein EVAR_502_1 [Eumeta japonica]|uniref:Uncharacterized protein n=1 Tax=Eumeta variegata TaxID=151549 RepID=A0A4C1SDN2_EUMVA|nr:hypothetical protein EVAR_502_1 [Eumeta japonica]